MIGAGVSLSATHAAVGKLVFSNKEAEECRERCIPYILCKHSFDMHDWHVIEVCTYSTRYTTLLLYCAVVLYIPVPYRTVYCSKSYQLQ